MGNNKSSCNNAKALRVTHEDQISNEPPNPSALIALVETSFDLSPDASDDDGYFIEEDEVMLNLSSSESDSDSDSEEEDDDDVFAQFRQDRAEALAAAHEMKEIVAWFHHPSAPIKVTAPPARCFFERASVVPTYLDETDATAPKGVIDVEGAEEQEERREALAAAAQMKETVSWFTNPSQPLKVSPYATASAASTVPTFLNETDATAPKGVIDVEGAEEQEERREALAAAAEMRETVSWYTNPSQPVKVSPFATAHCVSTVPTFLNETDATAPKGIVSVEEEDEQEERRQILATAAEMKKIASWYLHPSQPLETSPMASARCYFDRASAVEQETKENADDRAEALEAAKEMSKVVSWFTNPSQPVEVSPMASAHCTFSDKVMDSKEEADERAEILADCKQLSKVASWFSNPSQVRNNGRQSDEILHSILTHARSPLKSRPSPPRSAPSATSAKRRRGPTPGPRLLKPSRRSPRSPRGLRTRLSPSRSPRPPAPATSLRGPPRNKPPSPSAPSAPAASRPWTCSTWTWKWKILTLRSLVGCLSILTRGRRRISLWRRTTASREVTRRAT